MVDKEKFYDTIEARKKLDNNYPWLEEEVWNPRLEALGEDEDDIMCRNRFDIQIEVCDGR